MTTEISAPPLVATRVARSPAAGRLALATTALVAVGVGAFDWPLAGVVGDGLVPAVLFGVAWYFGFIGKDVPRGEVPPAPDGVAIYRPDRIWFLLVLAAVVPLTWLLEQWDTAAHFGPGAFVGGTVAAVVATIRVRRWESRHGAELLSVVDPAAKDADGQLVARPRQPRRSPTT